MAPLRSEADRPDYESTSEWTYEQRKAKGHKEIENIVRQKDRPPVEIPRHTKKAELIVKWVRNDIEKKKKDKKKVTRTLKEVLAEAEAAHIKDQARPKRPSKRKPPTKRKQTASSDENANKRRKTDDAGQDSNTTQSESSTKQSQTNTDQTEDASGASKKSISPPAQNSKGKKSAKITKSTTKPAQARRGAASSKKKPHIPAQPPQGLRRSARLKNSMEPPQADHEAAAVGEETNEEGAHALGNDEGRQKEDSGKEEGSDSEKEKAVDAGIGRADDAVAHSSEAARRAREADVASDADDEDSVMENSTDSENNESEETGELETVRTRRANLHPNHPDSTAHYPKHEPWNEEGTHSIIQVYPIPHPFNDFNLPLHSMNGREQRAYKARTEERLRREAEKNGEIYKAPEWNDEDKDWYDWTNGNESW